MSIQTGVLSKVIKYLRIYYNFKQSDLADKLKISRPYLSLMESGKKKVTLEVLNGYSDIFDIPISSIMLLAENIATTDDLQFKTHDKVLKILNWVRETTNFKRR